MRLKVCETQKDHSPPISMNILMSSSMTLHRQNTFQNTLAWIVLWLSMFVSISALKFQKINCIFEPSSSMNLKKLLPTTLCSPRDGYVRGLFCL